MRAAHIGACRAKAAGGVDGGDGNVDVGRRCVGLGIGQRGLRVLDGDVKVLGVELGNRVARLHHLVFYDVDLDHLPRNARADLNQVAIDLGVVSIFAVGRVPPDGYRHRGQHHAGLR